MNLTKQIGPTTRNVLMAGIVLATVGQAKADLVYFGAIAYQNGGDYYNTVPVTKGYVDTNIPASLSYSGSGPFGGSFTFNGTADAVPNDLKIMGSASIMNYPAKSYIGVLTPAKLLYGFQMGSATVNMGDTGAMIVGPNPTYELDFQYTLTGLVGGVDSNFNVLAAPSVAFDDGVHSSSDFALVQLPAGPYSGGFNFALKNIPSNKTFTLSQQLTVILGAVDSYVITDIDPFATNNFDPSHIIGSGSLVPSFPYSLDRSADFSHSLVLQSVTVKDDGGNIVSDAQLVSTSGITYPTGGQTSIPEPASLMMTISGISVLIGAGWMKNQMRRR